MIQPPRQLEQQNVVHYKTQKTYPSQICENDDIGISTQKRYNYDDQFNSIYAEIVNHEYFSKISKHEKIRINKWLTKLSNISTNDLWKKNRNNYIKLIRLMFDCQLIIAPFLMMPPERDLHKLTPHEINVIIDQVDKLIDERESKDNQSKQTNRQKVHKVQWTQQSAYIDHHNSSVQKSKVIESNCMRTYDSSKVTGHLSKLSQNNSFVNPIPPKHPSTTKNLSTTTKHKQTENNLSTNKQNYFIKQSNKGNDLQESKKYFIKKQKVETFQTQQLGQQEYIAMMKNSALQRNSSIFQQDKFQLQNNSRDAINILKCGFRLLQKIPLSSIEPSSVRQIQTFRRILTENDMLKSQFEKQNVFLQNLSNRCNTQSRKALQDNNSLNNTQKTKVNQKKKKLTLTSQSTTRN